MGAMARNSYEVMDRYELPCPACQGSGCVNCRNGSVPVYTLRRGHGGWRCTVGGRHQTLGKTERPDDCKDLPRVAWCRRCTWEQIHTDVPEAYDLEAKHSA
jgi:hypothetical protein